MHVVQANRKKKEIDLYLSRPLAFPPLLLICTTLRKDQCRRTLLLCLSIPTYLKLPAHIHEYCLAILVNFGPWLERDEREREVEQEFYTTTSQESKRG